MDIKQISSIQTKLRFLGCFLSTCYDAETYKIKHKLESLQTQLFRVKRNTAKLDSSHISVLKQIENIEDPIKTYFSMYRLQSAESDRVLLGAEIIRTLDMLSAYLERLAPARDVTDIDKSMVLLYQIQQSLRG